MEKFDLENFPTSESAKKMLGSVTEGFYDNSYVGKWIYQVMGMEWDSARELFEELPKQFFPETATWGLRFHEIKWGLPVRENLSHEERRRLIYQKRDNRSPMTPWRMEAYLADTTGFAVHIADIHDSGKFGYIPDHPNRFKVFFVGEGTLDAKTAKSILDKIKQSHTVYQMNDWVNIVFDHSALEKFELQKIKMSSAVNFWEQPMLDGTHLLDGSLLLGGIGRYNLIPGIRYTEGPFEIQEEFLIDKAVLRYAVQNKEEMLLKNSGSYAYRINFWKCLQFDGRVALDGSRLLDEIRREVNPTCMVTAETKNEEQVGTVTLRTRRNLAFLDGSLKLDGSRLLNSINRKEEL